MTASTSRPFGVLNLERGMPPRTPTPQPRFSTAFDFPVIWETVEGAWADRVIRGDPALAQPYIDSAKRLVERGAVALTSNCGFAVRHQSEIAEAVPVPVVMSSLLLLPALMRQLPASAKVGVLTADSAALTDDLLFVDNRSDRNRIVVGGIEGGELWQNEMIRPPPLTSVEAIQRDVVSCVTRLRNANPDIAALLFECTGFPMVSPALRQLTGLPIYDVADLCRLTYAVLPLGT